VAQNGLKTWDLAYRIKGTGKGRRVSLGRFPEVSLEQARERADELTRAARAGTDKIATEEAERAAEEAARAEAAARTTVGQLIALYVRRRVAGRLKTAKEIESRLYRALAEILDRPADEVRRKDVRVLLDKVSDEGLEREAEKRRQTVGAMFRWALKQDLVEFNPTAGLTAYDPGTPRDRVLTLNEIAHLWWWLDQVSLAPDVVDIIRLQIALGARCGEIAGLHAEEIDRKTWLWTLPASRSKNKSPRTTPLVGIARDIAERRLGNEQSGRLFASEAGTPLTAAHIGHALLHRRNLLPIAPFTTHDFRRSVATALADMAITLELIAAVIGHEVGGAGTRTLLRHYVRTDFIDRKRAALEAWDAKLHAAIQGDVPAEKVVRFPVKA
jgi:integrase